MKFDDNEIALLLAAFATFALAAKTALYRHRLRLPRPLGAGKLRPSGDERRRG